MASYMSQEMPDMPKSKQGTVFILYNFMCLFTKNQKLEKPSLHIYTYCNINKHISCSNLQ